MILDGETLELVNAIESMLEPSPSGEIKPELMESVLEISTEPCENTVQAGEQLRALRAQVIQKASSKGLAIAAAGTHPFAMWEDQRIVAAAPVPRPDRGAAVRRPPGADLRGPRARRRRRPGEGDPRRQRDAGAHAGAARAVGELAVLAGRRDRDGIDPDADLPRVPAGRDTAHVQGLGGLRRADRVHDPGAGDRGLHVSVVRRPPPPELRDGRGPGDGLADAGRPHARARGARPGAGQGALRALRVRPAAVPLPATRCSTRTSGWPPGTGSTASSSICRAPTASRRASWPSGCWTGSAPTAEELGSAAELEHVEDLLERGNGAARQVVVYEANHDLREVMHEIVEASSV